MPSVNIDKLLKNGNVKKIVKLLDHQDALVRAHAIRALMALDKRLIYSRLFALANDADAAVRLEAVAALGSFEDERALHVSFRACAGWRRRGAQSGRAIDGNRPQEVL